MCISVCVQIYTWRVLLRRKERSSESHSADEEEEEEEEGEGEEAGVWVEKAVKRDGETAFVGPVPEIKVQATVTKKE